MRTVALRGPLVAVGAAAVVRARLVAPVLGLLTSVGHGSERGHRRVGGCREHHHGALARERQPHRRALLRAGVGRGARVAAAHRAADRIDPRAAQSTRAATRSRQRRCPKMIADFS